MRFLTLCSALALLVCRGAGAAPSEPAPEENPAIGAIAPYSEEIRNAICEASLHPELFVKLDKIQRQSSAAFARLLAPYGRRDQEALWELARFPGLIDELTAGGVKSKDQIKSILEEYPREVHAPALAYGRQEYALLTEIADLNHQTDQRFGEVLQAYPPPTQESMRLLLRYPEVLRAFDKDLDLLILLGEAYQKDPDQVRQQAAALHLEAERQHAGEARVPAVEAQGDDLETPARSAVARYDYDLNGLDSPEDDPEVNVIYHGYYGYPYPYWIGYPPWYPAVGWYTNFDWYLTPRLSASIGFGLPLVRRPVYWGPRYYRPSVRAYYPHRSYGGDDHYRSSGGGDHYRRGR